MDEWHDNRITWCRFPRAIHWDWRGHVRPFRRPLRFFHVVTYIFSFHPFTFLKHTTSSEHSTFRFYVAKLFYQLRESFPRSPCLWAYYFYFQRSIHDRFLFPRTLFRIVRFLPLRIILSYFYFLFLILSMYLFVYTQVYLPVVIPTTEDGGVLHPQLSISYVTVYRRKVSPPDVPSPLYFLESYFWY